MTIEYHGMIFDSEDDPEYKRLKKTMECLGKKLDQISFYICIFIYNVINYIRNYINDHFIVF